jgi:hypothetical protein
MQGGRFILYVTMGGTSVLHFSGARRPGGWPVGIIVSGHGHCRPSLWTGHFSHHQLSFANMYTGTSLAPASHLHLLDYQCDGQTLKHDHLDSLQGGGKRTRDLARGVASSFRRSVIIIDVISCIHTTNVPSAVCHETRHI